MIYSPPYLFQESRPEILELPETIVYNTEFEVPVANPANVERVVLLTPTSETHSLSTGRFVNLLVLESGPGGISARAPSTSSVAPPGYYLLFVVDHWGVPSVGKFVQLEAARTS